MESIRGPHFALRTPIGVRNNNVFLVMLYRNQSRMFTCDNGGQKTPTSFTILFTLRNNPGISMLPKISDKPPPDVLPPALAVPLAETLAEAPPPIPPPICICSNTELTRKRTWRRWATRWSIATGRFQTFRRWWHELLTEETRKNAENNAVFCERLRRNPKNWEMFVAIFECRCSDGSQGLLTYQYVNGKVSFQQLICVNVTLASHFAICNTMHFVTHFRQIWLTKERKLGLWLI